LARRLLVNLFGCDVFPGIPVSVINPSEMTQRIKLPLKSTRKANSMEKDWKSREIAGLDECGVV
jgi:hypothetical protein